MAGVSPAANSGPKFARKANGCGFVRGAAVPRTNRRGQEMETASWLLKRLLELLLKLLRDIIIAWLVERFRDDLTPIIDLLLRLLENLR